MKIFFFVNSSVGVQGDNRSYSYVVGISSKNDPVWTDLEFLAKLIPRICHNINRVCYIAGGLVKDQVQDVTPTFLSSHVLSTLRQVDYIANQVRNAFLKKSLCLLVCKIDFVTYLFKKKLLGIQVLATSGCMSAISQMPVVLIPIHFDRDTALRIPSCQRSVVLRPFCTQDFMTGVPALPGKQLPTEVELVFHFYYRLSNYIRRNFDLKFIFQVVNKMMTEILTVPGISRVLYDLTPKPPGTTEWE